MDDESECWQAWRQAVAGEPVRRAVAAIFADIDQQIAARRPTCWLSGRCCHFEAFGHRLYVTGLEIAWLLAELADTANSPVAAAGDSHAPADTIATASSQSPWQARLEPKGLCPFQVNKLCTVHAIRPLGCRIFFCQEGTDVWQHELYEEFLTRLRRLHDGYALPYRYMEWRMGLASALRCASQTAK